ncbi:MAG TPA: PaaI family thioesterase [Candidatus Eremiobacteraceae bacterium]|nr:PaaI family thioesterase [Candidatus Eremiobacteraceae bacterium]
MRFEYGEGTARSELITGDAFAGWRDIMHGGVVAVLLDEAMAHATLSTGVRCVTARLEIRFRKPVPTDKPLIVEGAVTSRRGRVLEVSGTLKGKDGTLYAEGRSRFVTDIGDGG